MKDIKLSIILPSINPEKWFVLYLQTLQACKLNSFEIIAVGPKFPPKELGEKLNFRYVRDFGCPSRALQLGTTIAVGKYLTWIPDDSNLTASSYDECISLMEEKADKDGMTIRYSEGPNLTGSQHLWKEYWFARTHDDQKLKNIKEWQCAPVFLYNLEYFRQIGGLDCRFEHINYNTHDLAFRVQKNGGQMWFSPNKVIATNGGEATSVIREASVQNDIPLYKKLYNEEDGNPITIDYNNWRNVDVYWRRRYVNQTNQT